MTNCIIKMYPVGKHIHSLKIMCIFHTYTLLALKFGMRLKIDVYCHPIYNNRSKHKYTDMKGNRARKDNLVESASVNKVISTDSYNHLWYAPNRYKKLLKHFQLIHLEGENKQSHLRNQYSCLNKVSNEFYIWYWYHIPFLHRNMTLS